MSVVLVADHGGVGAVLLAGNDEDDAFLVRDFPPLGRVPENLVGLAVAGEDEEHGSSVRIERRGRCRRVDHVLAQVAVHHNGAYFAELRVHSQLVSVGCRVVVARIFGQESVDGFRRQRIRDVDFLLQGGHLGDRSRVGGLPCRGILGLGVDRASEQVVGFHDPLAHAVAGAFPVRHGLRRD